MLCCSWFTSGFDVSKSPVCLHVGVHDDSGDRFRRERSRIAIDRDVSEAHEREVRLECLRASALQRVSDGRLRGAQVLGVEVSILVEDLRVTKRHRRAGGTIDLQAHPAHHVLPEVEDAISARRAQDPDGMHLLDTPNRRTGGRDQRHGRRGRDGDRCPARRVEPDCRPSRTLLARVVRLAEVHLRGENWPRGGGPLAVARDHLVPSAGERHVDLREQRDPVAVDVALAAEADLAPIPAAAENGAERRSVPSSASS